MAHPRHSGVVERYICRALVDTAHKNAFDGIGYLGIIRAFAKTRPKITIVIEVVMYAVIKTGGKQYRVTSGETLKVEIIPGDVGSAIVLDKVLMVADGD